MVSFNLAQWFQRKQNYDVKLTMMTNDGRCRIVTVQGKFALFNIDRKQYKNIWYIPEYLTFNNSCKLFILRSNSKTSKYAACVHLSIKTHFNIWFTLQYLH